jgi:hypothetical protein
MEYRIMKLNWVSDINGTESAVIEQGDNYKVEVMRFDCGYLAPRHNGRTNWCVYITIWGNNPLMDKYGDVVNEFDRMCNIFPWHAECTYFARLDDGYKIGCDFSHTCDRDMHGPEIEDVPEVLRCAHAVAAFMRGVNTIFGI